MALFNCKDCGGKVSTAARFCPHCGRVVSLDDIYTGIKRNKRTYETPEEIYIRYRDFIESFRCLNLNSCDSNEVIEHEKIKTIRKILYSSGASYLKCFSPYKDGVIFTDSFVLYHLNDKTLPFEVGFTSKMNKKFKKEYLEKYNNSVRTESYPELEKLIPKEIPREIYKMNLDEFLFEYKVITDNIFEDKKIMRIKSENLGIISFNVEYLYDALKILKIDSNFELELYGDLKPIIIHNDEGEMGLILPIKTY